MTYFVHNKSYIKIFHVDFRYWYCKQSFSYNPSGLPEVIYAWRDVKWRQYAGKLAYILLSFCGRLRNLIVQYFRLTIIRRLYLQIFTEVPGTLLDLFELQNKNCVY